MVGRVGVEPTTKRLRVSRLPDGGEPAQGLRKFRAGARLRTVLGKGDHGFAHNQVIQYAHLISAVTCRICCVPARPPYSVQQRHWDGCDTKSARWRRVE